MSVEKRDFYGKEVTDAIKTACETLNVPQEMLDIEVVETGSTGIFGLIRKKARIRVSLKESEQKEVKEVVVTAEEVVPETVEMESIIDIVEPQVELASETEEDVDDSPETGSEDADDDDDENGFHPSEEEADASPESLEIVREELAKLVELMGFPSSVEVKATGLSVYCSVTGEFDEDLAGPEGKTLDSIQYLVRKIVSRKCTERLRITVNVGNFRERRLEDLKERALELAAKVKETGKTHVLPALNPSERREIHMILQEDKDVRSRSVGEGLFKKILIYKPGKGTRGGRRKGAPRGRRGNKGKNGKTTAEE